MAPKKPPRRIRSNVRAASKVQERQILQAAKDLAEHPERVVPRCVGHRSCFGKAERDIERVHENRENAKKLLSLAKWFTHPLAKAYAAMLLLRSEGEIKFMANARTPFGLVAFAQRGRAQRNHLIALQNWKDPQLRSFLVLDHVKKRQATVYVTDDELVCVGRDEAPPPEAFVKETARRLGLKERGHAVYGQAPEDEARLVLRWVPAETEFVVGASSASKTNTLSKIAERVVSARMAEQFDVRVEHPPLHDPESKPVDLAPAPPVEEGDKKRYVRGELSDRDLIELQRKRMAEALAGIDRTVYVVGDTVYEERGSFLDALAPSEVERVALDAALARRSGPLFLDKPSAGRALAIVWEDHAETALAAVAGSETAAREVLQRAEPGASIQTLLQEAASRRSHEAVESQLPRFTDLPEPAALADSVARAYRTGGAADAELRLRQATPTDPKTRAAQHAFERVLAPSDQTWKYSATETELAQYLEPHAKRLLECADDAYADALQAFSQALGFTETLRTR